MEPGHCGTGVSSQSLLSREPNRGQNHLPSRLGRDQDSDGPSGLEGDDLNRCPGNEQNGLDRSPPSDSARSLGRDQGSGEASGLDSGRAGNRPNREENNEGNHEDGNSPSNHPNHG